METDFNAQAQDGSTREIAGALFTLFADCARGDFAGVQRLLAARSGASVAQCVRDGGGAGGEDGMESSSSSDDEEEGDAAGAFPMPDGGGGEPMAMDTEDEAGDRAKQPPVADADGFFTVPTRRRR